MTSDGRYQGIDKRAPLNKVLCDRCRRVMTPTYELIEDGKAVCAGCKKKASIRAPYKCLPDDFVDE